MSSMKTTILICGDREWNNRKAMYRVMYGLPDDTINVNGACRGADKMSTSIAEKLGFECREYPANWDKYGRRAGPIRNQEMLNKEKPHFVIAFHENIKASKGTRDMIHKAKKEQIPVILITA